MGELGWILAGVVIGAGGVWLLRNPIDGFLFKRSRPKSVAELLQIHFRPTPVSDITVSERVFPYRVRADLQRSLERLFQDRFRVLHFFGVRKEFSHEALSFADCIGESLHSSATSIPPEYESLDIGEDRPLQVLKVGLWMLERDGMRLALLVSPKGHFGEASGVQIQIAVQNSPEGTQLSQQLLSDLERSLLKVESYRGKILSLEASPRSYTGQSSGITVHLLRHVERDQVILPEATLRLLDRNVIQFVRQREQLATFHQSLKKGILFYGPPGTGKTHTIHYLARALEGHTTLLISAEQVGLLGEYMTLARLMQPSIVVIEDVDLIARDRMTMNSPCGESMLNKLLNEMDGLKEDASILFLLTTNHPESLESALSARPGRVDQAIEFPAPDEEGRHKLIDLYAKGVSLSEAVKAAIVRRTDGVSAAFIKELMRRTVQFHLERSAVSGIEVQDADRALDEMLFSGGSLNLKLLGAGRIGFDPIPS